MARDVREGSYGATLAPKAYPQGEGARTHVVAGACCETPREEGAVVIGSGASRPSSMPRPAGHGRRLGGRVGRRRGLCRPHGEERSIVAMPSVVLVAMLEDRLRGRAPHRPAGTSLKSSTLQVHEKVLRRCGVAIPPPRHGRQGGQDESYADGPPYMPTTPTVERLLASRASARLQDRRGGLTPVHISMPSCFEASMAPSSVKGVTNISLWVSCPSHPGRAQPFS